MENFVAQSATADGAVATRGPTWARSAKPVRSMSIPTAKGH